MAVVTIKTPDLTQIKDLVQKYSEGIGNKRLAYGFEQFLNMLADKARLKCPVRTGQLQSSITYEIEKESARLVGQVGSNLAYAPYVELGTGIYGPHKQRIYPKNGKVLAWVTSGARPTTAAGWKAAQETGRAVFATSVAGQKAKPYLLPAVEENVDKIIEFLKNALE